MTPTIIVALLFTFAFIVSAWAIYAALERIAVAIERRIAIADEAEWEYRETEEDEGMKTKTMICPACDADEVLRIWREGDVIRANCPECGWTTGFITLGTGDDAGERIAAKVAQAQGIDTDGKSG